MPGHILTPAEISGVYIWGANCILSSDLLQLLCDRYDPSHPSTLLPNDVWQHYLLPEVKRTAVPFFSFLKGRSSKFENSEIEGLTSKMLNLGYFHFRVKTSESNNPNYNRSDVDWLVMLAIMKTILGEVESKDSDELLFNMAQAMRPLDSFDLPMKIPDGSFFIGRRNFPLNDTEVNFN